MFSMPTKPRPKTVDGLVFSMMLTPKPEGFGLSQPAAATAGRLLKGRGMEWNPWGLGALIAALSKDGVESPVFYARSIAKGVVPAWAVERADSILKAMRKEIENEQLLP